MTRRLKMRSDYTYDGGRCAQSRDCIDHPRRYRMRFRFHCQGVILIASAKKLIGALGITVCTAAAGAGTINHLASDRATASEFNYTGTGARSAAAAPAETVAGSRLIVASAIPKGTAAVTSIVLTVTKQGSGSGSVTSSPPGINCGADCDEAYANATAVTLTATPDAGSIFTGWLGACTGVGACNVSMSTRTRVMTP
jgi:hypothetical protein